MSSQPEVLVLSSGAEKGMAEIGALVFPHKQGYLSKVNTIIGCSVGAIIGYLLAIGYSPMDIMVLGLGMNIYDEKVSKLSLKEYAFYEHGIVMDKLRELTLLKLRYLPTFRELWTNHKIRLIIPTVLTSVKRPTVEYMDYHNNPDMTCLEAIKRSISIQPLFPPVIDGEKVYVDGAIIDPFPINLLDDGKTEILGVHTEVVGGHTSNFFEHMSLITSILVDEIKSLKIRNSSPKVSIITVKLTNSTITDSSNNRLSNFFEGYFEGVRFLESRDQKQKTKLD